MTFRETKTLTDEELWASSFGVQYTTRFNVEYIPRIPLMKYALDATQARSVLDVGTNVGWNLRALKDIDPTLRMRGVDINAWACEACAAMGFDTFRAPARAVGAMWPDEFDLVMHSGLMIHVPTNMLTETMESIIKASKRWVLAIEYDAEKEVVRREHEGIPRCWERPYGRIYEQLGLRVVQWGPATGYEEGCFWWLMEKR